MKWLIIIVLLVGGLLVYEALFTSPKKPVKQETKAEEPKPAPPVQAETPSAERKPAACPMCNGTGKIPCPDPMCIMVREGSQKYQERRSEIRKQLVKERGVGFVTPEMVKAVCAAEGVILWKRETPCSKCGGTDQLTCTKCNGNGLAKSGSASNAPPAGPAFAK